MPGASSLDIAIIVDEAQAEDMASDKWNRTLYRRNSFTIIKLHYLRERHKQVIEYFDAVKAAFNRYNSFAFGNYITEIFGELDFLHIVIVKPWSIVGW